MYSLKDRTKAVKLYIESGHRERVVIQTLGYPSRSALRDWYMEYRREGRLHENSASKPHYTAQQKAAAVEYFASNKVTLSQACRTLGYPTRFVLRRWILETDPTLLEKKHGFSQEEKLAALKALLVDGVPGREVAEQYGVTRATLYNWKRWLLGAEGIAALSENAGGNQ